MKRGFVLLFILTLVLILILTLTFVSATTIKKNLKIGESFVVENKNISLVKTDKVREKVMVCVNGEKAIISEDYTRKVNGVDVTIRNINKENATIKGYMECENNCRCSNDCKLNQICFEKKEQTIELIEPVEKEKEEREEVIIETGILHKEIPQKDGFLLALLGILAIVFLLVVIIAWRRIK